MSLHRDRDALAAIAEILRGTGAFAEVAFPAGPDPAAPSRAPRALIAPAAWAERPDASSDGRVRRVGYVLTLSAWGEDPLARFEALDRLTAVAQNALEGSSLGGACLPALSRLVRGRYEVDARRPETRLAIEGSFGYLVAAPNLHDASR